MCRQLDPRELVSVKFESNYNIFLSWKFVSNRYLENGNHYVHVQMCKVLLSYWAIRVVSPHVKPTALKYLHAKLLSLYNIQHISISITLESYQCRNCTRNYKWHILKESLLATVSLYNGFPLDWDLTNVFHNEIHITVKTAASYWNGPGCINLQ